MRKNSEIYALIGQNIRNIRKNVLHKTQRVFEKEINKSRSFITKIEDKRRERCISIDTLYEIGKTYNIDIKMFFEGYDKIANINNKKK